MPWAWGIGVWVALLLNESGLPPAPDRSDPPEESAVLARRRQAVLLQTANLLAGMANGVVTVVIPWLVIERTGSPAAAGMVAALSALPGIVVSPFVGALVDRLGRRRVSIGSDVLSAISVVLFPLADRAGVLSLSAIAALAVLGAVFDPAGYTARKALLPDVARDARVSVDSLNGIHEGISAAGWVVGPALGALGIATVGAANAFWITAVSFVLAIVAVAAMRVDESQHAARHAAGDDDEAFWSSTLRGARTLWADRPLRVITLTVCVAIIVYVPTEVVILPAYFEGLDSPDGYGLVMTSIAAGVSVASFAYGWMSRRMTRHRMTTLVMGTCAVAIVPMVLLPPLPVFVIAAFGLGLAWGPMNPLLNSLVQTRVPAHVQGRVYGVQTSLFYAATPLGMLVTGAAVEAWGVRPVYLACGALLALMCLATVTLPSLRGLDDATALAPDGGTGSGPGLGDEPVDVDRVRH